MLFRSYIYHSNREGDFSLLLARTTSRINDWLPTPVPRERYGGYHAGASELYVAHAPHGRYSGSLAVQRGRYGGLALPPRGAPSRSARALRCARSALRAVVHGHTSEKK